jgi:hypothetical protein
LTELLEEPPHVRRERQDGARPFFLRLPGSSSDGRFTVDEYYAMAAGRSGCTCGSEGLRNLCMGARPTRAEHVPWFDHGSFVVTNVGTHKFIFFDSLGRSFEPAPAHSSPDIQPLRDLRSLFFAFWASWNIDAELP